MKLSEVSFRNYLDNFVIIPPESIAQEIVAHLSDSEKINGFLTYAYYDREAGLSFDVLAPVVTSDNQVEVLPEITDCRIVIRVDTLKDTEVAVIDNPELFDAFKDRIDLLNNLISVNDEIKFSRSFELLDDARNDSHIDYVLVYLLKGDLPMEGCWVRIDGLEESNIYGTLLNEPEQDLGVHEGDIIPFIIARAEDGRNICVCDLNKNNL